jgi:hypothetical protein
MCMCVCARFLYRPITGHRPHNFVVNYISGDFCWRCASVMLCQFKQQCATYCTLENIDSFLSEYMQAAGGRKLVTHGDLHQLQSVNVVRRLYLTISEASVYIHIRANCHDLVRIWHRDEKNYMCTSMQFDWNRKCWWSVRVLWPSLV